MTVSPRGPSLIVFSDLDGTLLDHATYQWSAAREALEALKSRDIPLILASSKTAAEISLLRDDMGFSHCPAIVENGAGVLPAGTEEGHEAPDYARLRTRIDEVPRELRRWFAGFGDMSDQQVADATGLEVAAAKLARRRQFSEPGVWSGDDATRQAFLSALGEIGVSARQGGRFLTLSFGATKADQMKRLSDAFGGHAVTLALGDAPNDIEMLEAADRGVIIANPHAPALPTLAGEADGAIIRTTEYGPLGWNRAVLDVLANDETRE